MAVRKTRTAARSKSRTSRTGGARGLLVGTVKGAFVFHRGRGQRSWSLEGPFHFGSNVHDMHLDPRDGRTLLATATGGHLGPTLYRSRSAGKTWKEASVPPRFDPLAKGKRRSRRAGTRGRSVAINFMLTPGHAAEKGSWYLGTSPQGLFRSADGGDTWEGVEGWNHGEKWALWTNDGKNETPAGALLHSVLVDPRDARHLYLSLSTGGTFESVDQGVHWTPLNGGVAADFLPGEGHAYGQDPHLVVQHPLEPDVLWQQNHCGIYRIDRREGDTWERVGRNMPKRPMRIGDIGFPIVVSPTDARTAWVFPMDGTRVWPRTSPGARPAVYRTGDAGRSWERLDRGLPREQAWFTVYRQAMTIDVAGRGSTLTFGTTSGELWEGRDGGERWERIAEHLPKIQSVRAVRFA